MSTKEKVLVAMSGGVDSTVAALLLREQGYEVIGLTMKVWDYESSGCESRETGCCSVDAIHDARDTAVKFGFPHYVLDLRKEFEEKIISNFISEYLAGRTPNPCVLCNKYMKWEDLLRKADQLGCRYIATGHYANIVHKDGRYWLRKGADTEKDQTYVLWGLSQESLSRTLFPLGNLTKPEVREIARAHGMTHIAGKSESFDICFIPDNDYRGFLKKRVPGLEQQVQGGHFVSSDGKVLGPHEGYPFYTIGQRKGLVVAVGYPLYVNRIEPATNRVVLGPREELNRQSLTADQQNLMKYEALDTKRHVKVCIRYHDAGSMGQVETLPDGRIRVTFDEAVQGVTPGQSVVFYEEDELIGGAIIQSDECEPSVEY
jgi:tRNA-specific 2-thiouridylase